VTASEERCIACGRLSPYGGLRLTEEYEWLCARTIDCALACADRLRAGPVPRSEE
jgi:hypothetical protein